MGELGHISSLRRAQALNIVETDLRKGVLDERTATARFSAVRKAVTEDELQIALAIRLPASGSQRTKKPRFSFRALAAHAS